MASLNSKAVAEKKYTHEGARAVLHLSPEQQLRRSVMSCLLWEDSFYEDGQSISDRIISTAHLCDPVLVGRLAIEVRTKGNLRHVPLLLLCALLDHPKKDYYKKRGEVGDARIADYITNTIQRADELTELLSVYWKNGKKPLAAQLKKGLARAFTKFNAYSLAKYNRDNQIKLRDVLFLCHAKPKDAAQSETWKQLVNGTLESPDTWEVELSAGKDKRETFERLIREGKLGYLALLRNLRNMVQAGCDIALVSKAILERKNGAERVLPFRYVAAARVVPMLEPTIDQALLASISELPKLSGTTVVLVDVSGSMDNQLSSKSDLTRLDAAAALGSIINGDCRVFTFSSKCVEVPPRRGMAGIDVIQRSQSHSSTFLGAAIEQVNREVASYDRIIVITDEQSHDKIQRPKNSDHGVKGYMINVASYQNGVGYKDTGYVHIDGFSERVLSFINEYENTGVD